MSLVKIKNISIPILMVVILGSLPLNYLFINTGDLNNAKALKPKISNIDQLVLLHSYDFEDDVVGQYPTGITLSVNDPIDSGSVKIDNLGDEQQNHVALHKSGGSKLIQLRDTYYGEVYDAGELHFKFYHDSSLFGIHFRGSSGLLLAIDLWNGIVGRYDAISYTSYAINQWIDLIIYYDISIGWMFDINGVRFGDGYSFSFEHENPSGLEYVNWRSAFSGGGAGYLRLDDIEFYYYEKFSDKPVPPHSIHIDPKGQTHEFITWYQARHIGICTGEGTVNNPFVIENFLIYGEYPYEGIQIKNSGAHFIIRNCDIYLGAISVENSRNGKIVDNTINQASIRIKLSNKFLISENVISSGYIEVESSEHNVIENNLIDNGIIYVSEGSTYNTVSDNIISNGGIKIITECNNNDITSNIVLSGNKGIEIEWDSHNNYVYNNTIKNSKYGVYISRYTSNCLILANSIESCQYGVYCDYTQVSDITITENNITNGKYGMEINGFNCNITRNKVINNSLFGIYGNGPNLLLSENLVENNYYGIILTEEFNEISKNTIIYNYAAIDIESDRNTIHDNFIYHNDYGVRILDGPRNSVFCNSFILNNVNGIGDQIYWDNGAIGNYWSDYKGIDLNNDNIGDTPYIYTYQTPYQTRTVIDNYPIFNNPEFVLTSPENITYNEPGIYPATFGFENIESGELPDGWTFYTIPSDPSGNANAGIVDEIFGHNKVLKLQHGGVLYAGSMVLSPIFQKSVGTVEWWQFYEDNGENHGGSVYLDGKTGGTDLNAVCVGLKGDGSVHYYDGPTHLFVPGYETNEWHHFRVDFDCLTDTYDLYVDGNLLKAGISFIDPQENIIRWRGQSSNDFTCKNYFDAIGYSWDNFYNAGDNHLEAFIDSTKGYYPATYGFEDLLLGRSGDEINFVDTADIPSGMDCSVIQGLGGHNKVLQLYDNAPSTYIDITNEFSTPRENGIIEFWVRTSDCTPQAVAINLIEGSKQKSSFIIKGDRFQYYDGNFKIIPKMSIPIDNVWYHIQIIFECGDGNYYNLKADRVKFVINGISFNAFALFEGAESITGLSIQTANNNPTEVITYLDAIGYSWDTDYFVGDNLVEGLLINIEYNSLFQFINLKYSLDGCNPKDFPGSKVIPIPDVGPHTLQIFGEDHDTNIFQSNLQHFYIDLKFFKFISLGSQVDQWNQQYILLKDIDYDKTSFEVDKGVKITSIGTVHSIDTYREGDGRGRKYYGDLWGPFYSVPSAGTGPGNPYPWEWGLLANDGGYLTAGFSYNSIRDERDCRLFWRGYRNIDPHKTVYRTEISYEVMIDDYWYLPVGGTAARAKDVKIRFEVLIPNVGMKYTQWYVIKNGRPLDQGHYVHTIQFNQNSWLVEQINKGGWVRGVEVKMTLLQTEDIFNDIYINVDYVNIEYFYLNNELDVLYEASVFPSGLRSDSPINISFDLRDCTPDIDILLFNFDQTKWVKFGTTTSWVGEVMNIIIDQEPLSYVDQSGNMQIRFVASNIVGSLDTKKYRLWVNMIDITNTPIGTNVVVSDTTTGVNITFSEVTNSGVTSIGMGEDVPDPPEGFEVAGEYYEIDSDVSFLGVISLAIPYNEDEIQGSEEDLKILHWNPSIGWTDVTIGIDTEKNIIYGETTDFSIFMVSEFTDHSPPVITIEYVEGDGTDENPGFWDIYAYDDVSNVNLETLQVFINGDFVGNEFGSYGIPNSLGEHVVYVEIENNNVIFPLLGSATATINILDDDVESPKISNLQILDDIHFLNVSFYVQDAHGVSKIHVYLDENLIIIYNQVTMESNFEFVISNEWIMEIGTHDILIEIWDADDDRVDDSMSSIITGIFETSMEEMKQFVIWRIDQLIQEIQGSPDDSWRKKNNKATMINKLNELKDMIPENDFEEAYDKLLHDIKPKLTGLKTDENENPWVTSSDLQEIFRVSCNEILTDITTLIQALSTMENLEINTFNNYNMFVVNVNQETIKTLCIFFYITD